MSNNWLMDDDGKVATVNPNCNITSVRNSNLGKSNVIPIASHEDCAVRN